MYYGPYGSDCRELKATLITSSKQVYVLALLLAVVFLAAQLHCCVDLNARIMDTHVCPVCHTLGAAIATCAVLIAMAGAIQRLELFVSLQPLLLVIFRNITPRAPPAAC